MRNAISVDDASRRRALLQVLRDTRVLLARPENAYSWSSWEDPRAALEEIDALIQRVADGAEPDLQQLRVLFAPTGPISRGQFERRLARYVSRARRSARRGHLAVTHRRVACLLTVD